MNNKIMTPKEKAIDLINKFYLTGLEKFIGVPYTKHEAKQCALICVKQILVSLYDIEFYKQEHAIKTDRYWQEVKKEIVNYE